MTGRQGNMLCGFPFESVLSQKQKVELIADITVLKEINISK